MKKIVNKLTDHIVRAVASLITSVKASVEERVVAVEQRFAAELTAVRKQHAAELAAVKRQAEEDRESMDTRLSEFIEFLLVEDRVVRNLFTILASGSDSTTKGRARHDLLRLMKERK
jgi:hypothetical protein